MIPIRVAISFSALESFARVGEPVTVGVPWPRGLIQDDALFHLEAPRGADTTLQSLVLDRWSDGSIRWCLFDFLATWDGQSPDTGYAIIVSDSFRPAAEVVAPDVSIPSRGLTVKVAGHAEVSMPFESTKRFRHSGPMRVRSIIEPLHVGGLVIDGDVDLFVRSGAMRYHLRVTNPNASDHPGGNWDLGNAGHIDLEELSVFVLSRSDSANLFMSRERGQSLADTPSMMLVQASSGGENWQSANHLTREHRIDLPFRGYQCSGEGIADGGLRATPLAVLRSANATLAMTMPEFWQNFPKAIAIDESRIQLSLFPKTSPHEIQGGERKSHSFMIGFYDAAITAEPFAWARSPITATASPDWYASTMAIAHLVPDARDPNRKYRGLVQQAMDGPDTFDHKREVIDEYGWRHYGDIWGDHEAVNHPTPGMISHDNNQYDCIKGLLLQYLQTGDRRWLDHGIACAHHISDIDRYHTVNDKSAYNGGLFWHTYHYAPADTATHRSYPRALRSQSHFESGQALDAMGSTGAKLKTNYAVGGGPAAAHNYNTGLMIAYFLTGSDDFREAAIGLAEYVINLDDGSKTVFRWLSRAATGLAIESSAGYSGPGRASANSLHALLTGFQLKNDIRYFEKAESIIRQVVHPNQQLELLDLLNAELRWFYTMFLQALGRYLDVKIERNQLDQHYHYAQLSLLHYARWMAVHEYPILSKPAALQYPTETWAAQDMRKVEVFLSAAKHASGAERDTFVRRAREFFDYVTTTLEEFPATATGIATKSLCRPVVLMLNYGSMMAAWDRDQPVAAPAVQTINVAPLPPWTMPVPQKAIAIRRAKRIMAGSAMLAILVVIALIAWLIG
jgi:hypothetical protein